MSKKPWPQFNDVHTLVFDFDGVLTNNKVFTGQDGSEFVRCDRSDGLSFDILRKLKDKGLFEASCFILSTEVNPVVRARAEKLKITCHQGVGDKLDFLKKHFTDQNPELQDPFAGMIYFGNDLNDYRVITSGCFSVAPVDAHPLIREKASVCIDRRGGDGFVRVAIEEFCRSNGITVEDLF